MKRILFIFTLFAAFVCTQTTQAAVRFYASAPATVSVGDQFRLSFTITSSNVENFRAPAIKGFDVLMGPSRSEQSSTEIINGHMTSSSSITFTYILMATAAGSYSIGGATATINGQHAQSNGVHIRVVAGHASSGASGGGRSHSAGGSVSRVSSGASVFVTGTLNKTMVHEQEAVVLTYRIYTGEANLRFDNVTLPDFKGFHSQEIQMPANAKWAPANYKGRHYLSTIYRQFVLFPQQSGHLRIGSARFDAVVAKMKQSADPFDAFFNGGSNIINIKKTLVSPALDINVVALPTRPANFSGGVGAFTMSASINKNKVKTNDAITMHIVISGTGNLKLISNPVIHFPDNFETYDPKVKENSQLTAAGVTGNKTIDYLLIPRDAGKFTIPSAMLTYFDNRTNSYRVLRTAPFNVDVEKGAGDASQDIQNFTNKQDLKVLGEDIRYIKLNDVTLQPKGSSLFGSFAYWLWYILPGIAFIIFLILYHQQIVDNANVAKMRNKKANKVVNKRLKYAGKLLAENKKEAFYDELLKALWGYTSDKLSIPVSQLSKDNVEENMRNHGVSEDLIKGFLDTLNECEFARFAPGGGETKAMDKVYSSCLNIMSQMESSIKRK
jgi:hypothetical protein